MSESTSATINALKFEKIDLASRDPGKLAEFYNQVFGIEFKEFIHSNMTHYSGNMGGVELFLCPNEPAGVSPNAEGIQQFHIEVDGDLAALLKKAKNIGCKVIEEVNFDPHRKQCCVRDPDGNPWIISTK